MSRVVNPVKTGLTQRFSRLTTITTQGKGENIVDFDDIGTGLGDSDACPSI